MAIMKVFKNRMPFSAYFTKTGKQLAFIGGKFITDIEEDIKELEDEIKSGHPHIYVDEAEKEVDTEQADPLEVIRKKAIADYIASQAVATDKTSDKGTSENAPAAESFVNSSTVSEGAAGSDSAAAAVAVDAGTPGPATSTSAALASLRAGGV